MQSIIVYNTIIVFAYIFTILAILAVALIYIISFINEYGKKYNRFDERTYNTQINFLRIAGILLLLTAWILGSGENLDPAVKLQHLTKNLFIFSVMWFITGGLGLIPALATIILKLKSIDPRDLCKMAVTCVIWGFALVVVSLLIM